MVEMVDKKLEEFLGRNDLGEIFRGICIIETVYEKTIIFENRQEIFHIAISNNQNHRRIEYRPRSAAYTP